MYLSEMDEELSLSRNNSKQPTNKGILKTAMGIFTATSEASNSSLFEIFSNDTLSKMKDDDKHE